jgi:hypothetical protein
MHNPIFTNKISSIWSPLCPNTTITSPLTSSVHMTARPVTKRYEIVINVYAQHTIAHCAVNKQHSLGMTIENKEPNNLR